jgi:hypothetical protein
MSESSTLDTPFPSSNFRVLFDAALTKYTKCTGKDLREHPLAYMIERCESPDAILEIFQEQSQAFDEFRNGNPKLIEWLTPVVNGLHAISTSAVLNAGASLVGPLLPSSMFYYKRTATLTSTRYSPPQISSFLGLVFSSPCVSPRPLQLACDNVHLC